MQLQLFTGFNGALAALPHPLKLDTIVYTSGANVIVEQVETGVQRLMRTDGRITAFALSPVTGRLAATGTKEPADMIIWDLDSGSRLSVFQEHDIEVAQLAFSPDERLLMTIGCEKDCRVFVIDTATGKIVTKNHLPPREVSRLLANRLMTLSDSS
jgi:WD40 repeat protein